ncbi:PKD domain-containing protein [Candidatus Bipolaricaulota bacterium]|nr:PKD domain-containing protein [Candidatus Bipolaricaulota bacterium]
MRRIRNVGLGLLLLLTFAVGGCFLFPNRPPVAEFAIVYNTVPDEPLVVTLDASMSTDPDGDETITTYQWDFGEYEDGVVYYPQGISSDTVYEPTVTIKYPFEGPYTVTLVVWDDGGRSLNPLSSDPVSKQVILPNEEVEPTE